MNEFRTRLGMGLTEQEADEPGAWTVRSSAPRMTLDNQIRATLPFPTEVTVRTGPPLHMPAPPRTARPEDQTIRTPPSSMQVEDTGVASARPRRHSPAMLPVPFGLGAQPQDLIRTKVGRPARAGPGSTPPVAEFHEFDDGEEEYLEDGATDRFVPLPRSDDDLLDEGPTLPKQPTPRKASAAPPPIPRADDGLMLEYFQAVEKAEERSPEHLSTDPLPPVCRDPSRRRHRFVNVFYSIGLGVAVGLSLALVGAAFLLVVYH